MNEIEEGKSSMGFYGIRINIQGRFGRFKNRDTCNNIHDHPHKAREKDFPIHLAVFPFFTKDFSEQKTSFLVLFSLLTPSTTANS